MENSWSFANVLKTDENECFTQNHTFTMICILDVYPAILIYKAKDCSFELERKNYSNVEYIISAYCFSGERS